MIAGYCTNFQATLSEKYESQLEEEQGMIDKSMEGTGTQPMAPSTAGFDLDLNEIKRQRYLNKASDWIPPFGFPDTANVKLMLRDVVSNSGFYSTMKKDKANRRAISDKDYLNFFLTHFLPEDKIKKLNPQEKAVAALLNNPMQRRDHLYDQLEKEKIEGIPELFLINHYGQKAYGKKLIADFEELQGTENIPVDGDEVMLDDLPEEQRRVIELIEDMILALASLDQDFGEGDFHCIRRVLYLMVTNNYLRRAYHDVLVDAKYAGAAAGFIFAVSSLTFCRWPIDALYQLAPEVYAQHFGSLVYRNTKGSDNVVDMHEYAPIDLDLTSADARAMFGAYAMKGPAETIGIRIENLSDYLSLSVIEPKAILLDIYEALSEVTACEDIVTIIRGRLNDCAIHQAPHEIRLHLNRLSSAFDKFGSMFSEDSVIDFSASYEALDDFVALLPKVDGQIVSRMLGAFMQIDEVVDDITEALGDSIDEYSRLSDRFQELSKDPAKNAAELQELLVAMGQAKEESSQVKDDCVALARTITDKMNALARDMKAFVEEDDELGEDVELEADGSHREFEELLAISEEENKRLKGKVRDLTAQNDSLGSALADSREQEAKQGLSEDARALITKKFVQKQRLSVEECLQLTQSLYPNTVILPSAWTSAVEHKHFEGTDRLCDYLIALAGEYLEKVSDGVPDAEARKLFPSQVFAANESKTTQSGAFRKQREFTYNGNLHYFEKHLRIGVATDVRRTVRVHFDVIDGKLVIAFCGEHMSVGS